MSEQEYWYRYEVYYNDILLNKYRVARHTKCGVWLARRHNTEKFVLNEARKRWAYPSIEGARINFIKRRQYYLAILKGQHDKAVELLDFIGNDGENLPKMTSKYVRFRTPDVAYPGFD